MTSRPHGPQSLGYEDTLLEQARAGDEVAFGKLVSLHSDQVYRTLRRLGLAPADAEEVAQEVFLRAWRSLDGFAGRSQLSTWLYRIAFNEAHRRLGRREPLRLSSDPDQEDLVAVLQDAPGARPPAQALDHEFERTFTTALDALPDAWRVAVVLRDLEGLSTKEAAQVVGVRETAFKSQLHRGRMRLRGLLEPYLDLAAD